MTLRSLSVPASLAHRLAQFHPPSPPCIRLDSLSLSRPLARLLHHTLPAPRRYHRSSWHSAVLSPPSSSQSDPDPTLHTPLSHNDAPTLKEALDPALWFPDAEPAPAPPTASETAAAASADTTATDGDGSAQTGGLYFTTSHPQLHPVAPIAEAVAPLPCAYTPPDIAPLMDVEDIREAMEHVIVSKDDDEAEVDEVKVAEVKGLNELLEDVKADEEEAKKGKAIVC